MPYQALIVISDIETHVRIFRFVKKKKKKAKTLLLIIKFVIYS